MNYLRAKLLVIDWEVVMTKKRAPTSEQEMDLK